ncbi:DUF349 domain-containing protein [Pseudoalteromonas luteoviolacea]|uniref:DUF349 domain-containing protein n=1 Tax=Pseudoalteromonas luteoviolacea S4054 TaxID=1129367 RepID=A0A0F6A3Q0_9GAMM|nr:DUF349 domain-containing protein [Pseudoalteromonas luteoviolacea]AOT08967.1 hypothetical protein S4054249_14335 [Pseudoalteromonas luteoviolacea]AOT13879.1 hypothetical protein S40542_14305 [Pseudoalteromonas luteoviolacea]AOT18794.1 hypothetical protein S4054_14310 [Pseudoalteromonas luteoviolacea]KKE80830.1 hypothetical protein N479_03915 [Pseudoalteromonas luteoviolacea S4054]KZN71036.1 hypothetical protein N481_20220 [Pseudoalteromonas luteoviolacea S4047-1]
MIFKHLFTPKWKHPKAQVRLAAVDKLDTTKDVEALTILALEDDSIQIRKKVLNKIDDLGLWWKVYKQDQELKDIAEQHISQAVLSGSQMLSNDIREEYIDRYAPQKTLEKLAFSDIAQVQRVKLLKRIANSRLIEKAFKEGNEALQVALLDLIYQYDLTKIVLKSAHGEAKSQLDDHLEQARLAKVMPKQIAEQVKLILAKFNALREKSDYEVVSSQFNALSQQWQSLELKWLDEETLNLQSDKYQLLTGKLTTHIEKLKAQYDAEIAAQQAEEEKQRIIADYTSKMDVFERELNDAVSKLDIEFQTSLQSQFTQLQGILSESVYKESAAVKGLSQRLNHLNQLLQTLPEMIAATKEFQVALEALKAIEASDDLAQLDELLATQKSAYQSCNNVLRSLPAELRQAAKGELSQASKVFLDAMKPLVDKQQKLLKEARKKARDVQRLIEQGRFNIAFGVFNGLKESYDELTEGHKEQVSKQYEALQSQLAEFKDWQKYASAPKRTELLEQLDEKLAETDIDPKVRAAEVKMLRIRWNELGRIESEEEKQQAQLFDEKIELLFAPCRAYFAEQEEARKQVIVEREKLISQMKELEHFSVEEEGSWRKLESQFNRINKLWRGAGSLDSQTYQALNGQYREVYAQVNGRLKAHHQNNAEQKQGLVDEALAQVENENVAEACDVLKTLQKQWQGIGFAGSKSEHALWQSFRKHNDAVFAKREEMVAQQKRENAALEAQQRQELANFDNLVIEAKTQSELTQLQEQISHFDVLGGLNKIKKSLIEQVEVKLNELFSTLNREKFSELVNAVENNQEIPACWQGKNVLGISAAQLLLRLEILTNVESPEHEQQARMAEQVALLDEKLQGESHKLDFYLVSYFAQAKIEGIEFNSSRILSVLNA